MITVRPIAEADLGAAARLLRLAFGTFLGAPDPEKFWTDRDYVYGRFGADHTAGFVAEQAGRVVGSNFATRWGSVGFFGPVSTDPALWNAGVGAQLVKAASDQFEAWGVRHAGLFTFPHSAKHVGLYGRFGFHPRFLTAVTNAPAAAGPATPLVRYSELSADRRGEAEAACRELAEELYDGLDLGAEIRIVAGRGLGDTVLVRENSRLAGFAVCHWGPASEAGAGSCFVKFGAVRPGNGAEARFQALLDACAEMARQAGMDHVQAGVSLAREEAYRHMLARGFRTMIQGVAMHRPNEPGYSRPGLYVLDDWR